MRAKPLRLMSEVDPQQEMRRLAMQWLARRDFSRQELAARLSRKFPDDSPDAVLDWLEQKRFLDDTRFAEVFLRSRLERGHGPLRIRQDMRQKGLPDSLIEQQLAEQGADFFALARATRQRRFGALPAFGDRKEQARQLRFLQYRGFTSDQCFHALEADQDD